MNYGLSMSCSFESGHDQMLSHLCSIRGHIWNGLCASTCSPCKEHIKKKMYSQFMKQMHLTVSTEQDYNNSKEIHFEFIILQLTFL